MCAETKKYSASSAVVLAIVLSFFAVTASSCLVDSMCISDSDCSGDEQCDLATGDCFLECTVGGPESCPLERPFCLEEEHRCVECVLSDDCDDAEECIDSSCLPGQAPPFALIDQNPASPTFGEVVALDDFQGSIILIYFAGLG